MLGRNKSIVIEANGNQLGTKKSFEVVFTEDTYTLYGPPFPQLERYLSYLGEHGWEVVGLNNAFMILKRLKPNANDR